VPTARRRINQETFENRKTNEMAEYRRAYAPGGSWFFTVNLAERKNNRLLVEKIDLLRSAFEYTQQRGRLSYRRKPNVSPTNNWGLVGCADCKEAHRSRIV
jgi:hypothetical protein